MKLKISKKEKDGIKEILKDFENTELETLVIIGDKIKK